MTPASGRQFFGEHDSHFGVFHELMAFKVREILLVSNAYDAYMKNIEDRRNVDFDTKKAMVRVILYVEDIALLCS